MTRVLRHSHKSSSRYCSWSSLGRLSSPSARSGGRKIQAKGRKIKARFRPRIEPSQRVAPAISGQSSGCRRPSQPQGTDSKARRNEIQACRNKIQACRNKIQAGWNEMQIFFLSAKSAFSKGYPQSPPLTLTPFFLFSVASREIRSYGLSSHRGCAMAHVPVDGGQRSRDNRTGERSDHGGMNHLSGDQTIRPAFF